MIEDIIHERMEIFNKVGHPDLTGRFILKHGIEMPAVQWTGKYGKPKQCFQNAFNAFMKDRNLTYVEGYCTAKNFAFPFNHAWVTRDGKTAHDPTLKNPEQYEYFGITFPRQFTLKAVMERQVYGLLCDHCEMIDWKLMVKYDPSFQQVIDEVTGQSGGHFKPRLVPSETLAD